MRSPAKPPQLQQPCCIALYDFDPENPGELGFKVRFLPFHIHSKNYIGPFCCFQENDIIQLLQRVDDNWYEGKVNGKQGYFPQAYVEIKVPLP
jgi:endophilin-A